MSTPTHYKSNNEWQFLKLFKKNTAHYYRFLKFCWENSPCKMEPDVLFQRCLFHWFRKLAQMAGIDLFLNNYKPTAYTYVVVSTFYVFLFSCLWTIYSYEFDEKLICASMLAFDCQVNSSNQKSSEFFLVKSDCDFRELWSSTASLRTQ